MKAVKPQVFMIAETKLAMGEGHLDGGPRLPGVPAWLNAIGGDEALSAMGRIGGADLEQLIEYLGRRCYKSYAVGLNPNVTKIRQESSTYHKSILDSKHGSVTSHGHVTYAFENVSRVFTHELVRHAIGTDISQESLRYVRLTDIGFWMPSCIASATEPKWLEMLNGSVYNITPMDIFEEVIKVSEWAQNALAEYFDINNMSDFNKKKQLTSAFRRVAVEGLSTGIGMTFSIRALRWIIEQRTNPGAEEEIRYVFGIVARDAADRWPQVFQDMEQKDTGDGLIHYYFQNSKI